MPKLSSLLVRDSVVSVDSIEEALQRQVLEGGELDTALLELDALGENVLGAYRAASFGLAPASRDELKGADPAVLRLLPRAIAEQLRMLPIALDGDTVLIASVRPPSPQEQERLWELLGRPVAFRIATQVRVEAALALHYGVPISTRLRLLAERLESRMAGELRAVEPLPPDEAEPAHRPLGLSLDDEEDEGSIPPAAVERASRGGPAPLDEQGRSSKPPAGDAPAEQKAAELPLAAPSPPMLASDDRDRARAGIRRTHISGPPRGPFPRERAVAMLEQAVTRDDVLDVFFSFARQYFECAVLFAIREDRALGLEAHGLRVIEDVTMLNVPLARDGTLQDVVQSQLSRHIDMRRRPADRAFLEAIGRGGAQPCALLPISIRKRVVSLLYGDRNGQPFKLDELSDLIEVLPSVTRAFERLIRQQKLFAMEARKLSARQRRASPVGAFGRRATAGNVVRFPSTPGSGKAGGNPAWPIASDLETRPTVQLPMQGPGASSQDRAKPSARPPLAGPGVYSRSSRPPLTGPGVYSQSSRPARNTRDTRPERPSNAGLRQAERRSESMEPTPLASRRGSSAPPPRTLSQPPVGAGRYRSRDVESEVIGTRPVRQTSDVPADRARERVAFDRSPSQRSASNEAHGAPASSNRTLPLGSGAPGARIDPRRERDGQASPTDVVSVPPSARESIQPVDHTLSGPADDPLVIDLVDEADRLVIELCRCGPDDEAPFVSALLRLGEPALEALFKRFPGPLWFDRYQPRQRLPAGRDVCAIARALWAFEDKAVPYIALLLDHHDAGARLYATMLTADRVQPELLWPLYARLFDDDGQVRSLAMDALPHYRHCRGFSEMLKSLRERAVKKTEPVRNRLIAMDLMGSLRDAGSVPALIEVLAQKEPELNGPALQCLRPITGQDFGTSLRRWRAWYEGNARRHRAEWLIDSLTHGDESVRANAGSELQRLSQVYYGFAASASKREREQMQLRYREWWETEGRAQFGR